jgi:ubiquinone/menaquinone biosynthesis C-methylase UbiE
MSFDTLAPYYLWLERLLAGNKLQRCRLAWAGEVRSARQALVVGVGPGRFLEECVRGLPEAHFTCVDASSGMLAQARQRWQDAGGEPDRIRFIHARLPEWEPEPGAYDLIVTHFFLDCFPPKELVRVLAALSRGARPGAHWLLADFRVPERGWLKWRAQLILAFAYTFFRVVTKLPAGKITPPDALLRRNGFELLGRRLSEWGLLHSDLWRRDGI